MLHRRRQRMIQTGTKPRSTSLSARSFHQAREAIRLTSVYNKLLAYPISRRCTAHSYHARSYDDFTHNGTFSFD